VPRGATVRDLNAFSIAAASPITSASAPFEANIDNYISNLRAKSTQDLINEAMEQSRREFDTFLEDNIQINYDEQRQRIFEHFGLAKPREQASEPGNGSIGPGSRGAFGRSARRTKGPAGADQSQSKVSFGPSRLSKSVLGGSVSRGSIRASLFTDVAEQTAAVETTSAPEDPMMRAKQEKYASKVKELNSARLQEVCYPLVEEFGRVETDAGGDTPEHLIEAYRALKHIVKEDPSAQSPSDSNAVRERQYAKSYLEDNPGKSVALRKQILDGSRGYLEESFLANVDRFVAANPREANLGGVPSKVNKVRAYLRIKAGRKDLGTENVELQMLGEDYCWALIFYLLRAGLVEEAARYVAENERAIKSMDRHFTQYMAAFAKDSERRLPRDMQGRINAEYQQRLRLAPENSIDPYRMACYKIVGRCDLSRKVLEGVSTTLEDWVWLTISLAREVTRADEAAGEYYGLEDVRSTVEEIGQRHFSAPSENSSGYATFFYLQILVGMFEKAVSYLYPHNYVAAVHFAIALDFYGLLRVADFYTSDEKLRKCNLAIRQMIILTFASNIHHIWPATDQLRSPTWLLYTRLPNSKSRSSYRLSDAHLPQLRPTRSCRTIASIRLP
jgi:nuclear pore complex protein Nup93